MEYPELTPINLDETEKPTLNLDARQVGKHALQLNGFELLGETEGKYKHLRERLESRIIDQPAAVNAIIEALDRSEVRLPTDNRPIACLAFLGPTGVGKSESAKVLAELLAEHFGQKQPNIVKIDCSNFSHGHEVASLTGSPPGWVGNDTEPALSKSIVEKPGTVVLFDEFEKGSQPLFNLLLQIMGDGELKMNNDNSTTSFRNAVIILTSNQGAKEMQDKMSTLPFGLNTPQKEASKDDLERTAKKSFEKRFRPEFINRLDGEVVFYPLTERGLSNILDVKLDLANKSYERYLGVRLTLSDIVKSRLIEEAAEMKHHGARPLVRALEKNIQSDFGRRISAGEIPPYTHVHVFHKSEVPESYPNPTNREFIFASKPDLTIPKASAEELAYEEKIKKHEELRLMYSKQYGISPEFIRIDDNGKASVSFTGVWPEDKSEDNEIKPEATETEVPQEESSDMDDTPETEDTPTEPVILITPESDEPEEAPNEDLPSPEEGDDEPTA